MTDLKTAPYAIFFLRVVTGLLFITHGLTKLFVFTPAGTMGYFQSLGLPGWLGIVTMILEIVGGVALITGVLPRLFAFVLTFTLLGAALFGHVANGFAFNNAGGGWEYPVMWAAVMLTLAGLGDGKWALFPTSKLLGK